MTILRTFLNVSHRGRSGAHPEEAAHHHPRMTSEREFDHLVKNALFPPRRAKAIQSPSGENTGMSEQPSPVSRRW